MSSLLTSSAINGTSASVTGSSAIDGINYTQRYMEQQHDTSIWGESTNISDRNEEYNVYDNVDLFLNYVGDGKEDKALKAFDQLLEEMKLQPRYAQLVRTKADGSEDDTALRREAKHIIEERLQETTGNDASINDYIKSHTADVSEKHRQQDRYAWSTVKIDEHTTEDLLEQVCGEIDVDRTDKTWGIGSFFRGFAAFHNMIWHNQAGEV